MVGRIFRARIRAKIRARKSDRRACVLESVFQPVSQCIFHIHCLSEFLYDTVSVTVSVMNGINPVQAISNPPASSTQNTQSEHLEGVIAHCYSLYKKGMEKRIFVTRKSHMAKVQVICRIRHRS